MIRAGSAAEAENLVRFQSEARAVAQLSHPNIVAVHEVGEHDGLPFFSMEFCPGGGLDRYLGGTPIAPEEAARLVQTLARAMQAAHELKVVHRDLKPANVLLSPVRSTPKSDEPERTRPPLSEFTAKVSDFGLAKRLDEASLTQSGALVGTPSYMAPEQAQGGQVGPAADVYALGAILYECLTGRPPFKAATPVDTILQVIGDEPAPPTQLQPRIPRDIETICLKCLHKEAAKRYSTAAELAGDLERFEQGLPIKARRIGSAERFTRWCRRNPMIARLSAAVALLLVSVAVVATAGAWLARLEAKRANDEREKAESSADASRKLLGEQFVMHGAQLLEKGDLSGALVWFAEALHRDQDDPQRASEHRKRIGALLRQCPRPLHAFFHKGRVTCAAFSSDGRRVVTGSEDRIARVWDAVTGKPLGTPLEHPGTVTAAHFAPGGGGLVTVCHSGERKSSPALDEVRFWDLKRQQAVVLKCDRCSFDCPDGGDARRVLVLRDKTTTAQVYDLGSGKPASPAIQCEEALRDMQLVPGADRLVTLSSSGRFRLWNTSSGTEIALTAAEAPAAQKRPTATLSISVSLARGLFASAQTDGVQVWDAATGKRSADFTVAGRGHGSFTFSADGRFLTAVFAPMDSRLMSSRCWYVISTDTGQQLGQGLSLPQGAGALVSSPDGRRSCWQNRADALEVWDIGSDGMPTASIRHEGQPQEWRFSGDGSFLLVATTDKSVRLWDAQTGEPLTPMLMHERSVNGIRLSPDDSRFLTLSGNPVRLWPVIGPSLESAILSHEHPVLTALLSEDGRRVLTLSALPGTRSGLVPYVNGSAELRVWDAEGGRLIASRRPTAANGVPGPCSCAA
jgi:WD40 repeat protein